MKHTLITWTDKYCIGFEEIDYQHRQLIDMINELYTAFSKGNANDIIEPILMSMFHYAEYHFKTEELFFEKFNYSNSLEHTREHQNFTDQVNRFMFDLQTNNIGISYDVMNFLKSWLLIHIQGSDKAFGAELINKKMNSL